MTVDPDVPRPSSVEGWPDGAEDYKGHMDVRREVDVGQDTQMMTNAQDWPLWDVGIKHDWVVDQKKPVEMELRPAVCLRGGRWVFGAGGRWGVTGEGVEYRLVQRRWLLCWEMGTDRIPTACTP